MKKNDSISYLWRRLPLLAPLLGILFAFMLVVPAWAAVYTDIRIPINIVRFNPCANGGSGENVSLTGEEHILFSLTFDSNGSESGVGIFNLQDVTGVGQTTGNKYQDIETQITHFSGNLPSDNTGEVTITQGEVTITESFLEISQGSGDNFILHQVTHFTVNPDGTVTASVDILNITCS